MKHVYRLLTVVGLSLTLTVPTIMVALPDPECTLLRLGARGLILLAALYATGGMGVTLIRRALQADTAAQLP